MVLSAVFGEIAGLVYIVIPPSFSFSVCVYYNDHIGCYDGVYFSSFQSIQDAFDFQNSFIIVVATNRQ